MKLGRTLFQPERSPGCGLALYETAHAVNPALRRWGLEDWEFRVILGCIVSWRPARGTRETQKAVRQETEPSTECLLFLYLLSFSRHDVCDASPTQAEFPIRFMFHTLYFKFSKQLLPD